MRERGLHGVTRIASDDRAEAMAVLAATMHGVPWQRGHLHRQQCAQGYVPRIDQRQQVAHDIRSIRNAPDRVEAGRLLARTVPVWHDKAARLSAGMEANTPESPTVFALPIAHRRRMRASSLLEPLSRELERPTRIASSFPDEASPLRRPTAHRVEVSEGREAGRTCIRMDAD